MKLRKLPLRITKEDVLISIKEFKQRFARLKHKWTSAFQDVEVSHLLVTADLAKVSAVTDTLASAIGTPSEIEGTTYSSVWQAITHMSNRLQDGFTTLQESMHVVSTDYKRLTAMQAMINTQCQHVIYNLQDTLKQHETPFSKNFTYIDEYTIIWNYGNEPNSGRSPFGREASQVISSSRRIKRKAVAIHLHSSIPISFLVVCFGRKVT
jgi:hypothetical protein